jgi:hypothetical protein
MPMSNGRSKGEAGEADSRSIHGIQGEGNREADRRYREEAQKFAESGRVNDAARDAADSLDEDDLETDDDLDADGEPETD